MFTAVTLAPLGAQTLSFNFEGYADSTVLTSQYSGATFANAIILTAGITLDDLECPPRSGNNVASDNGGPMTISFASPLRTFNGYLTYNVPVTVQAFDSSNNIVASVTSGVSNNEALSGASGSGPNQLVQVTSLASIFKIVIAGSNLGTSFTVDDVTTISRCDINQDQVTNVADAQAMIKEALGTTAAIDDLNRDGAVNVVDIQMVIDAALGSACAAK